jgi:hypothetical protein
MEIDKRHEKDNDNNYWQVGYWLLVAGSVCFTSESARELSGACKQRVIVCYQGPPSYHGRLAEVDASGDSLH